MDVLGLPALVLDNRVPAGMMALVYNDKRSSVGMHTELASAANVWIPTEDHGNP